MKITEKKHAKPLLIAIIFLFLLGVPAFAADTSVVIYKNEACGHCQMYLNELTDYLNSNGITDIVQKNFVNDVSARKELDNFNKLNGIPSKLQGHMTIIINDRLVLEGHVPTLMISDMLHQYPDGDFPELVIYQDSMEADIKSYKVMGEDGIVRECDIDTKIAECRTSEPVKKNWWEASLLTLIIFTGLLAGIHPCTVAVLLFFIALLLTINKNRKTILEIGGGYILGVFLAYFLIGLGILKAITFTEPHFAAKVAAYLVILLGGYNVLQFVAKGKVRGPGIPKSVKGRIAGFAKEVSLPAAIVVGLLVGLCSFGCTAGIYLSVIGLIVSKAVEGVLYLLLYNIMFILPLIMILVVSSNKRVVSRIEKWEESEKKYIKLVSGLVMILLGLYILFGGIIG